VWVRLTRLRRERRARAPFELGLPSSLLRLEACDLGLHRPEEALALGELRLDRCSLRGTLLHDARLLRTCAAQLLLAPRDARSVSVYLLDDRGILVGDAFAGLEHVQHLVEALSAEDDLERAGLVACVQLDETGGQPVLRHMVHRARAGKVTARRA
jgi:hypothetical protein